MPILEALPSETSASTWASSLFLFLGLAPNSFLKTRFENLCRIFGFPYTLTPSLPTRLHPPSLPLFLPPKCGERGGIGEGGGSVPLNSLHLHAH
eukprot:scaffold479_cov119-Isochrysis_galbana.AAC.10